VGVVHRDLKPENVVLTWSGETGARAKLLDFGIAKLTDQWTGRYVALDPRALAGGRTEGFLGTPGYGAPEQIRDASAVTSAADVFSLGICAFEMLTGRSYWRSKTSAALLAEILHGAGGPPSLRAPDVDLPAAFDAWFAQACASDPGERFATAGDAVRALDRALAPHDGPTSPFPRATRSSPGSGEYATRAADPSLAATLLGKTVIASDPLRRPRRGGQRAGR
jgi:serine/threonine-protein kinase